ncbi:unnamed protein product, partial [Ectocarpus sp. 12 AP-2014]
EKEGVRSHGFVEGTQAACGKKSAGLEPYGTVGSWKTFVCVAHQPVPPSDALALIEPSTGRIGTVQVLQTLPVLSDVLSSSRERELLVLRKSASEDTGSRHRSNSRSLAHPNRSPINAWRRSRPRHPSSRQLIVPRTLVTRRFKVRRCHPSVSSVSAWG